jgi:hypothetical protein
VTKPFHKAELVARIQAIVRRSKGYAQPVIHTGELVVKLETKTVEVNGPRLHLTGKEYQMLALLLLRKGTRLTKEMFLNHLYGGTDEPEPEIIDVFICKPRKKLTNASNGTIWCNATRTCSSSSCSCSWWSDIVELFAPYRRLGLPYLLSTSLTPGPISVTPRAAPSVAPVASKQS